MNDFQHKGPKQTRDIDKMQLEWRRHLMVWLGDLKQQFHQINVHKDDHQYLYFFWRPFGSKQKPIMAKIERQGEKVMKKASIGLKKIQVMNFSIPRLGSDSDPFQKNF